MKINIKKLIEFIHECGSVYRFSRDDLIRPDTLLQHFGVVAVICSYMMDKINEDSGGIVFDDSDYAEVMRRAVVHDLEETITGDIIRPTKYANSSLNVLIKQLESESAKVVQSDNHLPAVWLDSWETAKKGHLGLVVKVADLLAAVFVAYREKVMLSNNNFDRVITELTKNTKEYINSVKETEFNHPYAGLVKDYLIEALKAGIEMLPQEKTNTEET